MNRAVIIIESQPPHLGQFLAVRDVIQNNKDVLICIVDKPMVMSTEKVIATWTIMLEEYGYSISSIDIDYVMQHGLPDYLSSEDKYYVSDKHLFVHLNSLNVDVSLLGHVKGYNDIFVRMAYRQGLAYDYLIGLSKY